MEPTERHASKKAPQPTQTNKRTTEGLIHSSNTHNPQRQKAGEQATTPLVFLFPDPIAQDKKPARDNGQQAP
jgi:hypothetical protein